MKWRCPVQHKAVKDREKWVEIVQKDGPFHRDYRPLPDHAAVRSWTQARLHHRLSEASPHWSGQQRHVVNGIRSTHHRAKGPAVDQSIDDQVPPVCTEEAPATTTMPLRVLWLCGSEVERPKTTGLRHRFGSEGMDIHVADVQYTVGSQPNRAQTDEPLAELPVYYQFPLMFDLIILECVEVVEETMLVQLDTIRALSQAPLIVLTDNYTLDWSLRALRGGADAIFTLNTSDDVIVARSNALLRRWA